MFSRLFGSKKREAIAFEVFTAAEDLKPRTTTAPVVIAAKPAPLTAPRVAPRALRKNVSFDVPSDMKAELNKLKGREEQELVLRHMVEEIYFQSLAKDGLVRARMDDATPPPFLDLMERLTGEDRKLAKEILLSVVSEDLMSIMTIDLFLQEKREALLAA